MFRECSPGKKNQDEEVVEISGSSGIPEVKGQSNPFKGHSTATSVNIKAACSIKEAPVPE